MANNINSKAYNKYWYIVLKSLLYSVRVVSIDASTQNRILSTFLCSNQSNVSHLKFIQRTNKTFYRENKYTQAMMCTYIYILLAANTLSSF